MIEKGVIEKRENDRKKEKNSWIERGTTKREKDVSYWDRKRERVCNGERMRLQVWRGEEIGNVKKGEFEESLKKRKFDQLFLTSFYVGYGSCDFAGKLW